MFNGRYTADPAPDEGSEFGQAQYRLILPGYFESMQTGLLAGRFLSRDDEINARPHVVVDETLAQKAWPHGQAIGQQVWVRLAREMAAYEVVGVVRRQAEASLHELPRETIFFPNSAAGGLGGINDWVVRTEVQPLGIVPLIKQELAAMDAGLPLAKVRPMTDYVADAMARTRFALQLIAAFGAAALAIAAIGLYAVIHYAVQQRSAEVGVRMSFGARGDDIFGLFLRHGLLLAVFGVGIGIGAATALSRSIAGLLVGVTAQDPPTYAAAALLFISVAAAASLVPAWRAARIEPMQVLREA
jgi:putative ABC transport system permease protein